MKKTGIAALVVLLGLGAGGIGSMIYNANNNNKQQREVTQTTDKTSDGKEVILSEDEVRTLATKHYPLYWAGPRENTQYSVRVTSHNAVFVRYIAKDDTAESTKEYLTVATYYSINGYDALGQAKKDSADAEKSSTGALIATFKDKPDNTYFSFPGAGFQVEVYSPEKGQSRSLVESGEIRLLDPKDNS